MLISEIHFYEQARLKVSHLSNYFLILVRNTFKFFGQNSQFSKEYWYYTFFYERSSSMNVIVHPSVTHSRLLCLAHTQNQRLKNSQCTKNVILFTFWLIAFYRFYSSFIFIVFVSSSPKIVIDLYCRLSVRLLYANQVLTVLI